MQKHDQTSIKITDIENWNFFILRNERYGNKYFPCKLSYEKYFSPVITSFKR